MRLGHFHRKAHVLITAVLIAAGATAAAAGPQDRYYERSFVLAANARCSLFQPQLTAALTASAWQARGAALRAGSNARELAATAARAQSRAASTPCGSQDLKTVSGRVQDAFAGWSRTVKMTFPGERSAWEADRAVYRRPTWRLVQSTRTGASPVWFGYAGEIGQSDQLAAVVSWHGRSRPTGVRLVMRDALIAPQPWLARDLPPQSRRRAYWAAGVSNAELGLLSQGRQDGQAWRFTAQAADALERLDPREIFTVEFVFRDGSIARSSFEVGDFAAARAFIKMGPA